MDRIVGLYLCLARRAFPDLRDTFNGYLAEPPHKNGRPIYDRYRQLLEAALSADHPTTLGFEHKGDEVTPRFGQPWSTIMQERINLQHRVISTFTRNIIRIEETIGRGVAAPANPIKTNLQRLMTSPSMT